MKILKNIIYLNILALVFTSCASSNFYQVYQTSTDESLKEKGENLVFEDENCIITYNLWQENGNIGFQVYNKTDSNLYINLENSFYILNGMANNYYKNRKYIYGSSTGSTATKQATNSFGNFGAYNFLLGNQTKSAAIVQSSNNSIAYQEEKVMVIPSKTSKEIQEYSIKNSLYRDCDLFLYPKKKEVKSVTFQKSNSPLVFSNRIAYTIGESNQPIMLENSFYVTSITNYPEKEIVDTENKSFCGQTLPGFNKTFKNSSANQFYLFYKKDNSTQVKH